jgi:uncharacterized protein (DUF3084 family)
MKDSRLANALLSELAELDNQAQDLQTQVRTLLKERGGMSI